MIAELDRLDLYRKSLVRAWGHRDYNDWPVKLNSVFHLFLYEFGEELLADLDYLEHYKGWPLRKIAELFRNPARIYRLIDSVIYSMRRQGYTLFRQRQEVLRLLSMVRAIKHGSEFNEDGRNIIYSPGEVESVAGHLRTAPRCNRDESALVHRLCGLLWAYTESIFFRAHDITKEIHGPYPLSTHGGNLVVKEYLSLKPTDIWPDLPLLQHREIRVLLSYSVDMSIEIDALNHLYNRGKKSAVEQLAAFEVQLDHRSATTEQIKEAINRLEGIIVGNTEFVDGLSWHQKVEKYAEIFWYRKAPLRKARGLDWKLPEQLRSRIQAGSPDPRRLTRLSPEQVRRLAMLTI